MNRIIYPTADGISVLIPADATLPLAYIAAKDVPAGVPYLIVDTSVIPSDRSDRAAWEADFSNPDGYGQDFGNGSDFAVIGKKDNLIQVRHEPTGQISTIAL